MARDTLTIRKLRLMLTAISEDSARTIANMEGESNPQIVRMREKAEVRRDTVDAILDAMGGDMMMLKIMMPADANSGASL